MYTVLNNRVIERGKFKHLWFIISSSLIIRGVHRDQLNQIIINSITQKNNIEIKMLEVEQRSIQPI